VAKDELEQEKIVPQEVMDGLQGHLEQALAERGEAEKRVVDDMKKLQNEV